MPSPKRQTITASEMLEQDATERRTGFATHLASLLRGASSTPPAPILHPILEAAPVVVGRPGKGGRKRRPVRNTVEGVLNELDARYGPGKELRKHRHILRYFEIDPEGDGALMARLSGNDISAGETVAVQLDVQHSMSERLGLRPRWVIVELNADRNVTYEERMGFALVRDLVAMHGLEWVSWREIDRIARDQMTNMAFCKWLRQHEIRLYFATEQNPLVDWNSPRLDHSFRRLLAEWEADKIVERTSNGLIRRFLETGRGWPGLIPFGFRRGPQDYLIVDDEQWAIVELIFALYLSLHPDGRPFSIRDVVRRLRKEGIDITFYVVQRVLSDRVYVTGCLTATYKDKTYAVRPIQLRRPISEVDYARAQAQRAARGGMNTVTPYGCFLLNHVLLVHAPCQNDHEDSGRRIRLSAQLSSRRPTSWRTVSYVHRPRPEKCPVLTLRAPPLERAVIEAIYRLAGDETIRAQWIANGRGEGQSRIEDPTAAETATIEAKLHRQRHRHADLLARFVSDDHAEGDAVAQYSELASALAVDIRRLEQRLDRMRRKDASHPHAVDPTALERRLREELPIEPPLDDPIAMRRRVEILRACVSKVVVHDDSDHGQIKIEILGPLIPPTAPPVTFLPGDDLGPQEVIGKTVLADQFLHAWRSPLLPVVGCARRPTTVSSLAADVRLVHRTSPVGLMFRYRSGESCAWTDRRDEFGLTSATVVRRTCRHMGCTPAEVVRGALTPREIVDGRRLGRINAAEWYAALCIAFEGGLVPGRGWQREWKRRCWPEYATLHLFAKANAFSPSDLLAFAYLAWCEGSDGWNVAIRSFGTTVDRAVDLGGGEPVDDSEDQ